MQVNPKVTDNAFENSIKDINDIKLVKIEKEELYIDTGDEVINAITSNGRFRNLIMEKMMTVCRLTKQKQTVIGLWKTIFVINEPIFLEHKKKANKRTSILISEPVALDIKRNGVNPYRLFDTNRDDTIAFLESKIGKKIVWKFMLSEDGLVAVFIDVAD